MQHEFETRASGSAPPDGQAIVDVMQMILRAEAFHGAGQSHVACEILLCAVAIEPRATRAWKDLGAILHTMGEIDDAISALEQALLLDPSDSDAATDLELVRSSAA